MATPDVLHQRPCHQTRTVELDPFAVHEINYFQAETLQWHPHSFTNCDMQTARARHQNQRWPTHGGNATVSVSQPSDDSGWPHDNGWSCMPFSATSELSEISPEYNNSNVMAVTLSPAEGAHADTNLAHCPPAQAQHDDWLDLTMWETRSTRNTPKQFELPSLVTCSTHGQTPQTQLGEWLHFTNCETNPLGEPSETISYAPTQRLEPPRCLDSPARLEREPRNSAWNVELTPPTQFRQNPWTAAPTPGWSSPWSTVPMPAVLRDEETLCRSLSEASTPPAVQLALSSASDDEQPEQERAGVRSARPHRQSEKTAKAPAGLRRPRAIGTGKRRSSSVAGDLMERNRAAANSSRLRQREKEEDLIAEMNSAKDLNHELRTCIKSLTSEVLSLKMEVLQHARCNSKLIYRYINRTAEQHLQNL